MGRVLSTPRIAPFAVHRERLHHWMQAYAQYPLRLIIAPAGCGKSTLLTKYALDGEQDTRFCALPEHCDPATLHENIGHALRAETTPSSYADLLALFDDNGAGRIDLIIDDADNGNEAVLEQLRALVEDTGSNVSLIYSARSREALGANEWIARGVAAVCDAKQLAFDAVDTAQLAAAFGAQAGDLDVRRLAEETDGWALAVASTVRIAAAENETLGRAYTSWRERASSFLYDFVGAELERVKADDAELFWSAMNGSSASPMRLRGLASRGLFIADRGGDDVRVYLPLYAGTRPARTESTGTAPPMHANLFREFSATIGGREIPWVRRRDQQIVKYLLLKPDGTASRLELAQVFWPETQRHLATQSVRTACSTIRKAIASVVGYSHVESYFRTSLDVKVDLSNVICDVLRFRTHVKDGQASLDRGDTDGALRHFGAAEKLYAGTLLEFETPEPWFAQHAAVLHDRYVMILESLCELNMELERIDAAQQFLARLCTLAPEKPSVLRLQEALNKLRTIRVRSPFERGTIERRKKTLEPA